MSLAEVYIAREEKSWIEKATNPETVYLFYRITTFFLSFFAIHFLFSLHICQKTLGSQRIYVLVICYIASVKL